MLFNLQGKKIVWIENFLFRDIDVWHCVEYCFVSQFRMTCECLSSLFNLNNENSDNTTGLKAGLKRRFRPCLHAWAILILKVAIFIIFFLGLVAVVVLFAPCDSIQRKPWKTQLDMWLSLFMIPSPPPKENSECSYPSDIMQTGPCSIVSYCNDTHD